MTGKQIVDFIKRHRLEDCDEINLDNDTINFNIILNDSEWIMYSLFDFGVGEDVVLWSENAELGYKEISFDEALILRGLKCLATDKEISLKELSKEKEESNISNWIVIKCSDDLPDFNVDVLGTTKELNLVSEVVKVTRVRNCLEECGWDWELTDDVSGTRYKPDEIIAWVPLPEGFKEETDGN